MEDIIKVLETKGEMKRREIYSLLKTNSKKLNSEISKKIKSFDKTDDFFNHYSNQTSLFELLNKVEFNSSKNYDEIFSSFNSNIEKYISCFTQIIISIKINLRTQEILNKIFTSSKQYLPKLKTEKKIENISQKNLFSFIENLLDFSGINALKSYSNTSPIINIGSFNQFNNNSLCRHKYISEQGLKIFPEFDFGKTLKIINEEPCTPIFGSKSNINVENNEKNNCQNIHIRKDSSLTLSAEENINNTLDDKIVVKEKRNSAIIVYNNSIDEKKYENLLEMINNIYRKGIINSEEKIRLKRLVIAKSKKLENLYNNTFVNKIIDKNDLRLEITKLLSN